ARKGITDIESLLIDRYKVQKPDIGKSLSQFYKCPYMQYNDRTIVDPELLKNLNVDYLKKNHWLPLKRDRTTIEILIDDPGDLDIEPYGDKRETVVRLRVDGSCSEYMKIPHSYRRAIVSRFKIMASLDIAERRKPQDGKIKFKLGGNKEIELRVATVPTAGYN